ncbi:hypothetical protein AS156_36020 [Bradyrhizobium macuxiense]|uniref:Uncharacterized protein n=1 Tax=Bradyrhizobium macuxiense TaxID=1755647 RepID=A0A109JZV7_9BRAD|nr:hypothetical protein [Bradyrhizobium macuxiense]KWV58209.1 hypothetical protein AS156_36020 [Bradyrhizobium macuxiense]
MSDNMQGVRKLPTPIVVAVLGLAVTFMSLGTSAITSYFQSQIITAAGILVLVTGASTALFSYLQDARVTLRGLSVPAPDDLNAAIRAEIKASSAETSLLTAQEREELLLETRKALSEETVQQLSAVWREEFQAEDSKSEHFSYLRNFGARIRNRLQEEVDALGRRANINLAIGSAVSAVGLAILTWFVWTATSELSSGSSATDVGVRFLIRLTLAAFVQLFAYFFLRLYRYSLFEIKYFQNEMTNAQFRLLALFSVAKDGDTKAVEKIAFEFAKTERNFVLKKGETTVAIQRESFEKDYDAHLIKVVEAAVGKKEAS